MDHFGGEPREKIERIGENPETYDGTDQQNARRPTPTSTLESEAVRYPQADTLEAPCPLGFQQENPIASDFCSDVDEVGFNFLFHQLMTHYILLINPKKCQGNVAGCHPQKADCHNSVGGFECKCKNYQYGYGDGYDQGSAERDGTRTRGDENVRGRSRIVWTSRSYGTLVTTVPRI